MKPTPPSIRNLEQPNRFDRQEAFECDRALYRELERAAVPKNPPSIQIRAYRDFERAYYFARGAHGDSLHLGYNLWEDAARKVIWARRLLTDAPFRKGTGFTARTAPRRALAALAEGVGYRYLRGLESIRGELSMKHNAAFMNERYAFLAEFELSADTAHQMNDRGQRPDVVLDVIDMFAAELIALCPWLERVGLRYGAATLKNNLSAICESKPFPNGQQRAS